jgi:hypothetical protein
MTDQRLDRGQIRSTVQDVMAAQPIVDMHTHVYPPSFGTPVANATGKTDATGLMLWGVDELVTYHYLICEVYRVVPATKLPYEQFWKMTRAQQADHIWKHLFVERTPLSEACRGVVTTLKRLGLDPAVKDLAEHRRWFAAQDPGKYIDRVMELANVEKITMTNDVFDVNERLRWLSGGVKDPRFSGVVRIDPMLRDWPGAARKMRDWDYAVGMEFNEKTIREGRRFLSEWIDRTEAVYLAVSLPPEWRYPATGGAQMGQHALEKIVLPTCAERGLPFALMIGARRAANPALRDAGDMGGLADVASLVNLCQAFPNNRFLVTILARENQHELAVAARKFGNLMVFGCWWFLNNPSLIEEITRFRFELLGSSFVPQHSDARILDQLIYKWEHSRKIIGEVLAGKYEELHDAGWPLTREDVVKDVRRLLRDNFVEFAAGR